MTFSIIIPVYNVAPYLRECLDSVLAQTFTDWETICVDDGSTDDSLEILDGYAEKDSRFAVIHQKNGGVSSARNVGIDRASGEWLLFVDADDALCPGLLQWLHNSFEEHPSVSGFCHYGFVSGRSVPCRWPTDLNTKVPDEVLGIDAKLVGHVAAAVWTTVVSRQKVGDLRFRSYSMSEDRLFMLEYVLAHKGWLVSDAPSYFYRNRVDSAVNVRPSIGKVSDYLTVQIGLLECLEANKACFEESDFMCLVRKYGEGSYFTFNRIAFRVLPNEWLILEPLWVKANRSYWVYYRASLWRRFVVWCASKGCPLGVITWLVFWHEKAGNVKRFIKRKLEI